MEGKGSEERGREGKGREGREGKKGGRRVSMYSLPTTIHVSDLPNFYKILIET